MLGHDHVARDHKSISPPHTLERGFEEIARRRSAEVWKAVIITEGQEMEVLSLLITNQSARHLVEEYTPAANVRSIPGPKQGPGGTPVRGC